MPCQRRGGFAGDEPEALGSGVLRKRHKLGAASFGVAGRKLDLAKCQPSFKLNLGSVFFPCFFQNGSQVLAGSSYIGVLAGSGPNARSDYKDSHAVPPLNFRHVRQSLIDLLLW